MASNSIVCLCSSSRGDLVDTYRSLHKEQEFDTGFTWSGNPVGKYVKSFDIFGVHFKGRAFVHALSRSILIINVFCNIHVGGHVVYVECLKSHYSSTG